MAILANGIITLDFGSTTWMADLNANFAIFSSSFAFSNKSLITHDHNDYYEVDSVTIDQAWLQEYLEELDTDLKFTNNTEGIVMVDTTVLDDKRIYIDNGIISTEVVT